MEIHEIKSRLTLANVLHHYGLKPDKSLRLNCPFHEDKTPSMQVYYKTHTAYCFSGNCKTHGKSLDVIDFVMYKENTDKHHALLKCIELLGGSAASKSTPVKPIADREMILQNMFTYFKNAVHNSKPAQEYLQSRGLDPVVLASGGSPVGYNTAQFHHGSRREEQLIKSCVQVGLLAPWGTSKTGEQAYKPFAKYSIVFPMRNRANQITGLYFRSSISDAGNSKHYYLKESTGLYPKYPKAETEKLIIAESIIDCATLLQIESIVKEYSLLAAYGTNRLTAEHIEAIKELKNLKEIVFAFDNDEAGGTATVRYAKELKELLPQLSISKLELPENEDVNETAQAHQPEIFLHLLENRTNLFLSNGESSKTKVQSLKKGSETDPTPLNFKPSTLDSTTPFKLAYKTNTASYYIQGGVSKMLDSMKVTLVIEHPETNYKTRNKLDLYEDKQVEKICKEVSEKLNLRKDILEGDIYKLTDLLDDYREKELLKSGESENPENHGLDYPLTTQERQQIEAFGKKENLIQNLNDLLGKAGIVGEEKNRIFLLIIAASYKMPETLHALIQGSSGSGKTRLLKQISDCIPKEKVTKLTRVSDKVLYNYPEKYFINRLLCLEDIDGLSEEAEFAFRELQSNGELNSATSSKLENGQIVAGQKTVKGPIASMACTTKGEIYEDNMSRCFLIAVDESGEQTKRIIYYQNEKAAGQIDQRKEQEVKHFVQNFLRELKPYEVLNPFANKIHLPEEAHKIRRLNDLFQSFVKMITVLNQYQRKKDDRSRLITQIEDIETAVEIMFESIVLKVDELDGSLRQFYEKLKGYLKKTYNGSHDKTEFTQREIRQYFNLSKAQCSRYFAQLTEFEYITTKQGHNLRKVTYKVDYWDNYAALRERIKTNLMGQLEALKNDKVG
jgi:DNA primase